MKKNAVEGCKSCKHGWKIKRAKEKRERGRPRNRSEHILARIRNKARPERARSKSIRLDRDQPELVCLFPSPPHSSFPSLSANRSKATPSWRRLARGQNTRAPTRKSDHGLKPNRRADEQSKRARPKEAQNQTIERTVAGTCQANRHSLASPHRASPTVTGSDTTTRRSASLSRCEHWHWASARAQARKETTSTHLFQSASSVRFRPCLPWDRAKAHQATEGERRNVPGAWDGRRAARGKVTPRHLAPRPLQRPNVTCDPAPPTPSGIFDVVFAAKRSLRRRQQRPLRAHVLLLCSCRRRLTPPAGPPLPSPSARHSRRWHAPPGGMPARRQATSAREQDEHLQPASQPRRIQHIQQYPCIACSSSDGRRTGPRDSGPRRLGRAARASPFAPRRPPTTLGARVATTSRALQSRPRSASLTRTWTWRGPGPQPTTSCGRGQGRHPSPRGGGGPPPGTGGT